VALSSARWRRSNADVADTIAAGNLSMLGSDRFGDVYKLLHLARAHWNLHIAITGQQR
jgi:hypothetical protein